MSDSTKTPSKYDRSFWSSLRTAAPGRKFWGRLVVGVLFTLPVVSYFASTMLFGVMRTIGMLKLEDAALAAELINQLRAIGFLFLSVIIMLCLLGIYFVFFVSVRVYGPQIALVKFINQLKVGNYEPFRDLRRDDQLKDIWSALQELAESLRRKG